MRFFKLIWLKLRGILKGTMEDPNKVQAKINLLNGADPQQTLLINVPGPWEAVNGYFATLKTDLNNGTATFFGNNGFVLKLFFNRETGEIKCFPAQIFEKD